MSVTVSRKQLLMLGMSELNEDAFQPRSGRFSGGMKLYGGGKGGGGGSAPTPDPNIGIAALKNAQIGEDWLSFAREQFTAGNIRQEDMDALTNEVITQQLDTQKQQAGWATEDRARYKDVFQPLQNEFIQEAKNYGSVDRQAQAAAEAKADVTKAADAQLQTTQRQMASMGLNPNSGRFQAVSRAGSLNTALASAGAQNAARTQLRDKALALKADAINMGAGLPSQTAQAAGIGLNAGNSAVGNQTAGNANFYQNQGVMNQGFAGAVGANNSSGSILNNLYGNQVNAWSAQQQANAASSAGTGQLFGSLLGTAGTLGSSYMMSGGIAL